MKCKVMQWTAVDCHVVPCMLPCNHAWWWWALELTGRRVISAYIRAGPILLSATLIPNHPILSAKKRHDWNNKKLSPLRPCDTLINWIISRPKLPSMWSFRKRCVISFCNTTLLDNHCFFLVSGIDELINVMIFILTCIFN